MWLRTLLKGHHGDGVDVVEESGNAVIRIAYSLLDWQSPEGPQKICTLISVA